jgi:hypothetical protein
VAVLLLQQYLALIDKALFFHEEIYSVSDDLTQLNRQKSSANLACNNTALAKVGISIKIKAPTINDRVKFFQVSNPFLPHFTRKYNPPGMYKTVAVTTPGEYSPLRRVAEIWIKELARTHILAHIPTHKYLRGFL